MLACTTETQIALQSEAVLGQYASMYYWNTDCYVWTSETHIVLQSVTVLGQDASMYYWNKD